MDYEKLSDDILGEASDMIGEHPESAMPTCCRGNTAVLQATGGRSELDAGGNESNEFVGVSLSSHSKVGAYDCRLGGL